MADPGVKLVEKEGLLQGTACIGCDQVIRAMVLVGQCDVSSGMTPIEVSIMKYLILDI